jgi:hypothetical protein
MSAVWYRVFFDKERKALSQYAVEMFAERGRGAVVLREREIVEAIAGATTDVAFEYYAEDSDDLPESDRGPFEPVAELARQYDPLKFMVIAIVREEDSPVTYPLRLAPEVAAWAQVGP